MITTAEIPRVLGHTAYDRAHNKLGTVNNVYVDNETGQPAWMTVNTGLFGTKETFVPIEPAEVQGEDVVVPFAKEQISHAPKVDTEASGFLPEEEEARLYDYYGTQLAASTTPTETAEATSTATRTPTDDAMTRSEERLRVSKQTRETGRARLRKYVITEEQQVTVPVTREEVHIAREPISEENIDRAMSGPEISEAEHEVILHEERPVVSTETVPVERVRLEKETVVEEETVGGTVRKERIESEGIADDR